MHIDNVIFLILSKNAYTKFSEGPTPMDYISAKRFVESEGCVIAGYDTVNDEPIFFIQDDNTEVTTDEELPF